MTNTEIIYQALLKSGIEIPELELEEADGRCIACGKEMVNLSNLSKTKYFFCPNCTGWGPGGP